jgi:hypothetical protein
MNYIQKLAAADSARVASIEALRSLRETARVLIDSLEQSKAPQVNILQNSALNIEIDAYDIESIRSILESSQNTLVELTSVMTGVADAAESYGPVLVDLLVSLPVIEEEESEEEGAS